MKKFFTVLVILIFFAANSTAAALALKQPVKGPNVSGHFYPSEKKNYQE